MTTATAPRRPVASRRRVPLGVRLRVFASRRGLDRSLAAGAAPTTPELRLRARQLTSSQSRATLVSCLDHVLDAATESPTTSTAPGYLRRTEIRAAEPALRHLADLVRDGADGVRGLAMASVLLRDGASPLYEPGAPHSPAHDASAAADALEEDR